MEKEYTIDITPGILELLGPSLYTNIYYVLAELIANAYDADAKNVYVIRKEDAIIVEDDGKGMSYEKNEVKKFLEVARNSRVSEDEAVTALGRKKMGRKGVGKLAALSVSENVWVKTVVNGEKSGFILSRVVGEDKKLEAIPDEEITFERIDSKGTSIVMKDPQYKLSRNHNVVMKNLIKIFPLASSDFAIHVILDGKEKTIKSVDKTVVPQLATLIAWGDGFREMTTDFSTKFPDDRSRLCNYEDPKIFPITMKNTSGEIKDYNLIIEGWIGTYITTSGHRTDVEEFQENHISLYANKKMGEFNILPQVGKNKMTEMFIVGQLHVDLFELTELPDMALSNRQGYKMDDPRYQLVLEYVREEVLPRVYKMRDVYTNLMKAEKQRKKFEAQKAVEDELANKLDEIKGKAAASVTDKIAETVSVDANEKVFIQNQIEAGMNAFKKSLGLKARVDGNKKRLMISHAGKDKDFADVIYKMLIFNGFVAEEILYTSCDDAASRLPETAVGRIGIYDYIKKFFVDSASDQKMYIIFATSHNTKKSWGAMTEIGAAWVITNKNDNMIFNIKNFKPELPLDDASTWQETERDRSGNLFMSPLECDKFVTKIMTICEHLGYEPKSKDANKDFLGRMIIIK